MNIEILFFFGSSIAFFLAVIWGSGSLKNPSRFSLDRSDRFVHIGFICLTLSLLIRGFKAGYLPAVGAFSAVSIYLWSVALTYIVFDQIFKLSFVIAFVTPLLVVFSALACFLDFSVPKLPLALKSKWFVLHMVSGYMGYALSSVGFVVAISQLLLNRELKLKRIGRLISLLPPLETLERLLRLLVYLAFPIFSAATLLGMIWAHMEKQWYGENRTKIFLAFLTWFFYGFLMIARNRMRGRWMAYGMIFGFLLIILTFLGVSLFSSRA